MDNNMRATKKSKPNNCDSSNTTTTSATATSSTATTSATAATAAATTSSTDNTDSDTDPYIIFINKIIHEAGILSKIVEYLYFENYNNNDNNNNHNNTVDKSQQHQQQQQQQRLYRPFSKAFSNIALTNKIIREQIMSTMIERVDVNVDEESDNEEYFFIDLIRKMKNLKSLSMKNIKMKFLCNVLYMSPDFFPTSLKELHLAENLSMIRI